VNSKLNSAGGEAHRFLDLLSPEALALVGGLNTGSRGLTDILAPALAAIAVVVIYGVIACTAASELGSRTAAEDFYNRLVAGFVKGQLSLDLEPPAALALLPDPYDPRANAPFQGQAYSPGRFHDLSYFHGKFYLYFSVIPAVVLFLPFHVLTGAWLSHQQACFLFASVAFLAGAGLVHSIRRRAFPSAGPAAGFLCTLCVGLVPLVPIVLQRPDVWEVPITAAYAFWMLSLLLLWIYLRHPGQAWLAALGASTTVGLALGCRPDSFLGAALLLWPLGDALGIGRGRKGPRNWARAAGLLLPPAVIGCSLLAYNAARYGHLLDFGQNYQLAGDVERIRHFRTSFFWYNFHLYFLADPGWQGVFPFVRDLVVPPPPAGYVVVEAPVGVLTLLPFTLCAAAVPFGLRRVPEGERTRVTALARMLLLLFGCGAGIVCLYFAACTRYQLEFVPVLVLLAAIGFLALVAGFRSRPWLRRGLLGAAGCAAAASIAFNLAMTANRRGEVDTARGYGAMQAGRREEAVALYRQAQWLQPASAVASVGLANLFVQEGNFAAAGDALHKAVTALPNSARLHVNYGYCLYKTGRLQEALAECETALRLEPGFPDARKVEQEIRAAPAPPS
jgi:tetratricopeptide (TPR) repeat protein